VAVAIWISILSACPRWFLIEPQATPAPVKARKSHQIAAKAGAFDGSSNVRFGSKADMCSAKRHVRFTPKSDIKCDIWKFRYRSGHHALRQKERPPRGGLSEIR